MKTETTQKSAVVQEGHEPYTDKYFLRSREILKAEDINPIVRYQVFARQDLTLEGVDEAVEFLGQVGRDIRVYGLRDGEEYRANEPILKLEGHVQDLVDLETYYLEILSGNLTGEVDLQEVRENAKAVYEAASGKAVLYFGARHFHYDLDEAIARICKEEGFVGCSTDIGAKAWNARGMGTIPHALVLSYAAYMDEQGRKGNATVEAAKAFDNHISKEVPRIVLVDTFNREITDSIATARVLPSLMGARIDTCGENYTEGSREVVLPELNVPEKYLQGRGVTIASAWGVRRGLDEAGLGHLELTLSSGFNAEKTAAFVDADKVYQEMYGKPLFDAIGTGSLAKPIMTTSDIVAYYNRAAGAWRPMVKVGRCEMPSTRLELRVGGVQ